MAESGYLAVHGHEEIRRRFSRAVENGRLPQSLLLYGGRGTGKQRLALWTAAALNCQGGTSRPCTTCRSCRLIAGLQHPDVHWFFPVSRPKRASGPGKLEQKLEDQRAAVLEERRSNLLYVEEAEGATGIYVGAVQAMRRLAHKSPAMGPIKVLIIGHAEAMIPQTGSEESANALLKLLEEPPEDTYVILTSEVPGALLATIRSRLQAVHIPPLTKLQVSEYLTTTVGLQRAEAQSLAARSEGSIGRALQLRESDDDSAQDAAIGLVRALLDGRFAATLATAHQYRSSGARGAFSRSLSEASRLLRDLLVVSAGAGEATVDHEALARLRGGPRPSPKQIVEALEGINEARELAERNVNPQLVVANLLRSLNFAAAGVDQRRGGHKTEGP